MNTALWILGAMALGGGLGAINYMWDALDGDVKMLGGFLFSGVVTWGFLLVALEVLAWAFELVPGIFVIGGLLGLFVEAVVAFVLHLAFPLVKAFLPKPAPAVS